jgi:putative transposase
MNLFNNKYRIPSARFPNWDYRKAGAYFITICTQNREYFFGEIIQNKMKMTTAGIIVKGCWYEIERLYPSVELGAFVVMPNHIHGILIIHDISNATQTLPNVEAVQKGSLFFLSKIHN